MSDKGTYAPKDDRSVAVRLQPYPKAGAVAIIDWLLQEYSTYPDSFELLEHLKERADHGREKHGTYLMSKNGRDPKVDTYQEILDAIFYSAQCVMDGTHRYTFILRELIEIANCIRRDLEVS